MIVLLLSDRYYEIPADVEVVYEIVERIHNSKVPKFSHNAFPNIGENYGVMAGIKVVEETTLDPSEWKIE